MRGGSRMDASKAHGQESEIIVPNGKLNEPEPDGFLVLAGERVQFLKNIKYKSNHFQCRFSLDDLNDRYTFNGMLILLLSRGGLLFGRGS